MEDILLEFAQEHGIKESEVHRFLAKKLDIKTLEDLENLPEDMREQFRFIGDIPRPLREFIDNSWDTQRHKTYTLERIADGIRDRMDYDDNDEPMSVEDSETNSKLQKVIDCMIDCRFGSVVYDW